MYLAKDTKREGSNASLIFSCAGGGGSVCLCVQGGGKGEKVVL